uniref:RanBP1 domain containing protein n=1 Tax=Zea mays TaxID=4577 RepID=B6TKF2_MAIZE|nr:ranBP1 domain containing protein [Zea mays]
MADEEQAPSSRKRVAGTQINKDNPEPDDEGTEQEMGTFKKATEEVMATRRIVKVRRQQTSSASSNPFSAIRFAPTDSSAQTSAPVPEVQPSDVKVDEGSNGSGKDTLSLPDKTAGSGVNTDSSASTEAPPQPVETSDKAEDTKDESSGDKVVVGEPNEGSCMPSEVEGKTKEGDAEEKERTDEAGNIDKISKDDTGKKDGDDTEKKDGGDDTGGESEQKGQTPSATPLFSFKNLSSGQNAFTGLTGTGFSSTSFSFGSASKDGSSAGPLFGLKADGSSFPSFNLGAATNGGSATALATSAEAPKMFAMTEGPVETGEENEKAVFSADSALYEYLDGGWKERGKGELKLNVPVSGGERARPRHEDKRQLPAGPECKPLQRHVAQGHGQEGRDICLYEQHWGVAEQPRYICSEVQGHGHQGGIQGCGGVSQDKQGTGTAAEDARELSEGSRSLKPHPSHACSCLLYVSRKEGTERVSVVAEFLRMSRHDI